MNTFRWLQEQQRQPEIRTLLHLQSLIQVQYHRRAMQMHCNQVLLPKH